MTFSKEEFDIMVYELLYQKPVSFDMLCHIADKTLKHEVKYWCNTDETLKGRNCEDDLMQEIHIRLMKTTVSHFLLKDGEAVSVNNDPKGFKSWIRTVAINLKKDFSNKIRKSDFKTDNIDNPKVENELIVQEPDDPEEKNEQLKEAFSIAISANVNIYKVLTWIAQFVFIINMDVTKIQSNNLIVEAFGQKTLFDMYDMILKMSSQIKWLEVSEAQNERILKALNEPWKDDIVYGDVKYMDFFMKVNGEKSGKKSISDWVNRMNSMIQKKMNKQKNNSEEGK